MRRYLLFCGACYYARGGWVDFLSASDDKEELIALGTKLVEGEGDENYYWWQVVDVESLAIVASHSGAFDSEYLCYFADAIKP